MTTWQIGLAKLHGVCKYLRGDFLSYWIRPTTADVGIRAFANSASNLVREMTLGMQELLISTNQDTNALTRNTARWEIKHSGDNEILVIKWLDEVLYRAEVYDEFLIDCQVKFVDNCIESQVSFVDKNQIQTELEIKAVTTHQFMFCEVEENQKVPSLWAEIPEFIGPGWYGDVVFDI